MGTGARPRQHVEATPYFEIIHQPNNIVHAKLAHEAAALESALDAADSIDAKNSLEKMLAHQLAAGHRSAMKLVAEMNRQKPPSRTVPLLPANGVCPPSMP